MEEKFIKLDFIIDVNNPVQTKNVYTELNKLGCYADQIIGNKYEDINFINSQLDAKITMQRIYGYNDDREFFRNPLDECVINNTSIGCLGFIVALCPDTSCKLKALEKLIEIQQLMIKHQKLPKLWLRPNTKRKLITYSYAGFGMTIWILAAIGVKHLLYC